MVFEHTPQTILRVYRVYNKTQADLDAVYIAFQACTPYFLRDGKLQPIHPKGTLFIAKTIYKVTNMLVYCSVAPLIISKIRLQVLLLASP
jgi:hypothetical protein